MAKQRWWVGLFLSVLCLCGHAQETVNINTADVATLDRVLVNIGPAKAAAIVAFRTENGPFKRIEDLGEVKGIGAKTLEKNRDRIIVSGGAAASANATLLDRPTDNSGRRTPR